MEIIKMKYWLLVVGILLVSLEGWGQTTTNYTSLGWDKGNVTPSYCTEPSFFVNTSATPNVGYQCVNHGFVALSGGASPSGVVGDVQVNNGSGGLGTGGMNCVAGTCTMGSTVLRDATNLAPALAVANPTTGARYIWWSQNADAAKGPFDCVVDTNLFASTQDEGLACGYNISPGGGHILAGEPSWYSKFEEDYQVGTDHFMEHYVTYRNASGSVDKRPIFIQINRGTDAMNSFEIRSGGVNFSDWASATDESIATLNSGGLILHGLSTQTTDTVLQVEAHNGHKSSLSLAGTAGGFGINNIANNNWRLDPSNILTLQGSVSTLFILQEGVSQSGSPSFQFETAGGATLMDFSKSGSNSLVRRYRQSNSDAELTQYFPLSTISATNVIWNFGQNAGSKDFNLGYYDGTNTVQALLITQAGVVSFPVNTNFTAGNIPCFKAGGVIGYAVVTAGVVGSCN